MLNEFGVGHIGWTIGTSDLSTQRPQYELLTNMMKASGRHLHVSVGDDSKIGHPWAESVRSEGLPLLTQESALNGDAGVYPGRIQSI